MNIDRYMYMNSYIYMYVYIYIHIYIYIRTHTYIHVSVCRQNFLLYLLIQFFQKQNLFFIYALLRNCTLMVFL